MHTALKNLWASVAIDAGAVLDRDRSGAGDLTLETSGLRPADRSRPSDLTLSGWEGPSCDYMIDFACVSSTTPTWSNDPRWCSPGIVATEAEHGKLAADRASSAPVQDVHRYYPFVVEDRSRLGKSAFTVVYIFAVLLAVRNFHGGPSAPTSCFLRGQSVQALRNFVASQPAEFRRHLSRTRRRLLQRVSACVHGTLGGILSAGVQMAKSDAWAGTQPAIPAGAPAPEGGEQGAQEPLPAELDALDTELEYVDFAYFGQVPPSGLEPPPRDGDEPRLWILTGDDTELEKRLTAQAIALEKRLAEQFEAATAALLARLAPPVLSPPPKGTQPAIPAGAPAPEGGEQGAQEPLPVELDALDTELEYVDFAYFGQVPPSGLEPPPRDGDEPRLWILTGDDTELEKRLTAQAIALEKRLAEQFEAATAALLARLAPPVLSPPPKGTQPAIPAGAPAPEGGEQGAQEPLPVELDALDTELEYVDFAYFGQVPPSGLEPPPRDGDEPRLWILTDDTATRGLAEQRGLTAYDKYQGDPRNELVSPWRDDGVIIPGFEASRHPPNLEGGRRCLQSRQSFDDAEASLKAAARWPNPAIPSPSESGSEPVAKRSKVPDRGAPANDAVDGEVTIEEALRASRTREANRLAVRQHRERKKDKVNVLTEENAQLRERVSELEGEVERLQRGVPALDLDERTELEKLRNMRHQIADLVKK
eukprot:jgi/Tetstr1/446142/TSEL_033740.t1